MFRHTLLLLLMLIAAACDTNQKVSTEMSHPIMKLTDQQSRPKNIILMIGDGMGLSQISAGMYANGNQLNLEAFPVIGLQKTYSSDNLITDSAASATAIACGKKTYNGAIGVGPDQRPVRSVLEEAEKKGLHTGLVATSTIVHATPASFIAHQIQRDMYDEIAVDFLKTDIDLFIGGGKKYFDEQRKDEKSLIPALEKKGYLVADISQKDLAEVDFNAAKKIAYFTANDAPIPAASGREYLEEASIKSANFLKRNSDKGFFLMIEGSQIDWGGHSNNTNYIISEVKDFNKAIGAILAFAEKDRETLVIVTADHETGGFAINSPSRMDSIAGVFTSTYHTATMVPIFAYGPGSELFNGIYENTAIYDKMRVALGFVKEATQK